MDHEGLRLKVYKDSLGFNTIGYGRCLDTQGITKAEAMFLLENDITNVLDYCQSTFTWFDDLDDTRKNVVASMVFNLGASGLAEFKKTIAAINKKEFDQAATEMLNSKWAAQVGKRAVILSQMLREGDTKH